MLLFGSAGILRNFTLLGAAGLACGYKSLTLCMVTTTGFRNGRKEMQKDINLSLILLQLKHSSGSSASRDQVSNSNKGKNSNVFSALKNSGLPRMFSFLLSCPTLQWSKEENLIILQDRVNHSSLTALIFYYACHRWHLAINN